MLLKDAASKLISALLTFSMTCHWSSICPSILLARAQLLLFQVIVDFLVRFFNLLPEYLFDLILIGWVGFQILSMQFLLVVVPLDGFPYGLLEASCCL